jgi:hypothetical protein
MCSLCKKFHANGFCDSLTDEPIFMYRKMYMYIHFSLYCYLTFQITKTTSKILRNIPESQKNEVSVQFRLSYNEEVWLKSHLELLGYEGMGWACGLDKGGKE